MNKLIRTTIISLLLAAASATAYADGAEGVWRTESTDEGYLHVSIAPCENALCGTIIGAYNLEDQANETYEHLGKNMVWDMKSVGEVMWKNGKIWDPTNDKTYKSKMTVDGDVLSVSGCVLMFCRSQDWTRVE